MPVRIPNDLPARAELADENIFVMPDDRGCYSCSVFTHVLAKVEGAKT